MYDSFFGLTGLPFRLIPDPSFLFVGKGHRDAVDALQQGLAAGARVVVLTGEVGAGKTTLLQALLAKVDETSNVTLHISASGLDAEMLSDRLAEALGLPRIADPVVRRDALLEKIRSAPRSTLLIIDEAQHLTSSAFELLESIANVAGTAPGGTQICLVGQPELRILLNAAERSAFHELIGVDRHLRPLEETEIRLYVEHRLHRAGWNGRPEFEDAAFTEIFIFSAGIPRRVNLLCNSLMLSAWLKRQQRIGASAVTQAAAALRSDSFQGAPDLLDIAPDFERLPTVTDELEADASDSSIESVARAQSVDDAPPLPLNDTRPGNDVTSTVDARSKASLPDQEKATRRRRQAILASAVSLAVALTAIAVIRQQTANDRRPQNESADVIAERTTPPASRASAAEPLPPHVAPRAELATPELPSAHPPSGEVASAPVSDAATDHAAPLSPGPGQTAPACSATASALGLCEADQPSATGS
jgi:type II secretory pathway predicted ATPase ExeA